MAIDPPRTLGTVRTVPIGAPGALLDLLPEHGGLAWVTAGEGMLAWGTAARLDLGGPDRYRRAEAWWRTTVDRATPAPAWTAPRPPDR